MMLIVNLRLNSRVFRRKIIKQSTLMKMSLKKIEKNNISLKKSRFDVKKFLTVKKVCLGKINEFFYIYIARNPGLDGGRYVLFGLYFGYMDILLPKVHS